jgi:hypothetical protein
MTTNEEKWEANQAKVAFLKKFPGLIQSWEETSGQQIQSIIPLNSDSPRVVLEFSDGSFAIAPPLETEPRFLREAIETARLTLELRHPEAYIEYDRLAEQDKEASRNARLENILGAIQNNLDQIPELKDRIRSIVKKWNS